MHKKLLLYNRMVANIEYGRKKMKDIVGKKAREKRKKQPKKKKKKKMKRP